MRLINSSSGEPRLPIRGDHTRRTFRLLNAVEGRPGKAAETIKLLNDCYPSGTSSDELGATVDQLKLISNLRSFDGKDVDELFEILREGGGLSSSQASHVIGFLAKARSS